MKTLLVALNAKFIHSSLALRCLCTSCMKHGVHEVELAEFTINHNAYDILRHIYDMHARVIGFSCYIWNIEMTWHIIDLIKEVMPDVKIVVGGPEVSYTAQEILQAHSHVDYVLQGEGEDMLPELLQALEAGEDGTDILGVMGRVHDQVKGLETFREVPDLNALPFPYEGEDFSKLANRIIYYESSRGCPFHCQYCLSGMSDTVRFLSVERVIRELKIFVTAGVRQVKFVDRTFNCNPAHYRPILEYMTTVKEPINFHLEIEPGLLTDEDLALLAKAPKGRIQLEMGIQSTYDPTLKAIHRHNDWSRITHIMNVLRQMDTIHLHLDLIVGLPYEDYNHLKQSFNDIYSLHPHKLQIGFLKLLKGCGLRRDYPEQFHYDPLGPYEVLSTTWLPYDRISYVKVFEDVFERIYNSGKFFYTLSYLDRTCDNDYFSLYASLTDTWLAEDNDKAAMADEAVCKFLLRFITTHCNVEQKAILKQLLILDILTFYKFRMKADFLGWTEAPRSITDPLWHNAVFLRHYFPDYAFTNWRDIKMRYRVWKIDEVMKNEMARYMDIPAGDVYMIGQKNDDGVIWKMITLGEFNG